MGEVATASLIIPTYRRPDLLRRLLESLSKQRTTHRFEVIVVNDGADRDLGALEVEFSDISTRVITLGQNRGRAYARNEGVRNSHGDVLIFVDDDMTVVEDFVERHMAAHVRPEDVVIGDVLSPPEYKSHPLARYIERQGVRKLKSTESIPPKSVRTGNVSVSRQLFDKAGQFDEAIVKYGEDIDLGMRLSYAGANFLFAEPATSFHHHPPDLDDMITKMREYGRYTVPLLARNHPELRRALRIDLAEPLRLGGEGLLVSTKKIGLRVILTPPCYALALGLYRCRRLGRLLFPVIDYIRAYNYIRAYWQAEKDARSSRGPETS